MILSPSVFTVCIETFFPVKARVGRVVNDIWYRLALVLAKYLIIDSKGKEEQLDLDDLDNHEAIKGEFRTFIEISVVL